MIRNLKYVDDYEMYTECLSVISSSLFYHKSKSYESVFQCLVSTLGKEDEKAIRWFVTNTARALKSNANGFIVSFKPNYYSGNPQKIGYRGVKRVIDTLEQLDYIDIHKGYVKEWEGDKAAKMVPSFVTFTPKYLDILSRIEVDLLPSLAVADPVVIRSREDKTELSLRGRSGIKEIKEGVQVLNDQLKQTVIRFGEQVVKQVEYKRIYSDNLKSAGRFYVGGGGVQLLPQKFRSKFLTFDSEPVVELDYNAIHPNISYTLRNRAGGFDCDIKDILGEDFKPYGADLSFVNIDLGAVDDQRNLLADPTYDPVRNLAKITLLISINSLDINQAVHAISSEMYRDKSKPKEDQQFVGLIPKVPVKKVCEAIRDHNTLIEDIFFSDAGIRLQNIDSNIIARVVQTMAEQGESVLIYHDSAICRASCEQMLYDAMVSAWKDELGDTKFCKVEKKK